MLVEEFSYGALTAVEIVYRFPGAEKRRVTLPAYKIIFFPFAGNTPSDYLINLQCTNGHKM